MKMIAQCRGKIEAADIVLVGLGREFNVKKESVLDSIQLYKELDIQNSPLDDIERQWVEYTLINRGGEAMEESVVQEKLQLYDALADYLHRSGKDNYYVITTCNDDIVYGSKFDKERIVAPLGTMKYMKCDKGCFKNVYDTTEVYDNIYSIIMKYSDVSNRESMWEELKEAMPQCPMCKQVMSVNMYKSNNYSPEGYRQAWDEYMAWLQKTLNRKLVMLELGEGFDTPTVIRWPFEKVAAVNNKATLIRVHESFWQIAEDIEEKALLVKMTGAQFIGEIVER